MSNIASAPDLSLLRTYANVTEPSIIPEEERERLQNIVVAAGKKLEQTAIASAQELSEHVPGVVEN